MDQYPAVRIEWKLHHRPELFGYDAHGKQIGQPIDLSRYKHDYDGLHALFATHFERRDVEPPPIATRMWRRLFGWGYGISTFEAAMLFVCAGIVLLLACYVICFRYTACCDSLQDI